MAWMVGWLQDDYTTSKFGMEYDSLSDLVAFGVAPSILSYVWALSPYGKWGWLVAFLFATCGALRLARFNVQVNVIDKSLFNGLPIPAAAIIVASSILIYYHLGGSGKFNNICVLRGWFFSTSDGRMSRITAIEDMNYFLKKPFMSFVLILVILIIVIAEPQVTIFTFAAGYGLSGPIWTLYRLLKRKSLNTHESKGIESPASTA